MGDYGETDEESRERVRLERAAIVARYDSVTIFVI